MEKTQFTSTSGPLKITQQKKLQNVFKIFV